MWCSQKALSILSTLLYLFGIGINIRISFSEQVGAGYALLFTNDAPYVSFPDFPFDDLTFEAWISSSDICHPQATILSFAAEQNPNGVVDQGLMNAFVVLDPFDVKACRGYEEFAWECSSRIWDEYGYGSYFSFWDISEDSAGKLVSRKGVWHHLAVTYEKSLDRYSIYVDGLIVKSKEDYDGKQLPVWKNGTLILGSDQDCLGGCTSVKQSFYGMMDEVKIWKRALSSQEILENMRLPLDFANQKAPKDLLAYWNFNEKDSNIAKDLTGNGHDLILRQRPRVDTFQDVSKSISTNSLAFKNSWAMKSDVQNMPQGDFTVEFWANTPPLKDTNLTYEQPGLFSFASVDPSDNTDTYGYEIGQRFLFDAISVSKHNSAYWSSIVGLNASGTVSTLGALSLHVNDFEIIFPVEWTDSEWHHIAFTWVKEIGKSKLVFDDKEVDPLGVIPPTVYAPLQAAMSLDPDLASDNYYYFNYDDYRYYYYDDDNRYYYYDDDNDDDEKLILRGKDFILEDLISNFNKYDSYVDAFPQKVDPTRNTNRSSQGSLVLGQLQRNYGGGFFPRLAFTGALGVVRVWDRALDADEIRRNMWSIQPTDQRGLVMMYDMQVQDDVLKDTLGVNDMYLGGAGARRRPSTVPLTNATGQPLPQPQATGGYALRLYDQVTLMRQNFQNFPLDAITVEFWMLSSDTCRSGTPFSYSETSTLYDIIDNAFTITNYNDWDVWVMNEQQNTYQVGIGATDGNWHHVAVAWNGTTGIVSMFQDGKLLYKRWIYDGKLVDGGTLVIGREQDCTGGCFDSAAGASSQIGNIYDFEDIQDFFGLIDEMRIWNHVLSPSEIQSHYRNDAQRLSTRAEVGQDMKILTNKGLVARWSFDEGNGYVVHDSSGNGNDLYISGEPIWEPVIINSKCGNGVLEDLEECDDGNTVSGDGCSARCHVEGGWSCSPGSPSDCRPVVVLLLQHDNKSNGTKIGSSNGAAIAVGVIFTVLFIGLMLSAFVFRRRIYDQFPWIENKVNDLFTRRTVQYNEYTNYEELHIQTNNVPTTSSALLSSSANQNIPFEPVKLDSL